jgi:hypothetical protein
MTVNFLPYQNHVIDGLSDIFDDDWFAGIQPEFYKTFHYYFFQFILIKIEANMHFRFQKKS